MRSYGLSDSWNVRYLSPLLPITYLDPTSGRWPNIFSLDSQTFHVWNSNELLHCKSSTRPTFFKSFFSSMVEWIESRKKLPNSFAVVVAAIKWLVIDLHNDMQKGYPAGMHLSEKLEATREKKVISLRRTPVNL